MLNVENRMAFCYQNMGQIHGSIKQDTKNSIFAMVQPLSWAGG